MVSQYLQTSSGIQALDGQSVLATSSGIQALDGQSVLAN